MIKMIGRVLPRIIFTTSSLLIIISVAQLGATNHATKIIAESFPEDSYAWYGPTGSAFDDYTETRFVQLSYDWMTENFVHLSAGFSCIAGILGLLSWVSKKTTKVIKWIAQALILKLC